MDVRPLADAVRSGDRRALSRAITLVESTRADHRDEARQLLEALLPHTGSSRRIGFSGAPGVGKSTLIEVLGLQAVEQGHRVAVLAIDPSSDISGGSILGDKTRMVDLARHDQAFIRPSPSSGTLGGIARRTREALLLCEAAGFDIVAVETVGVGQSEGAVSNVADLFVLVAAPGGGDELQGLKRGIMELADVVAVNKCDGDLADAARRAASDLTRAVHLLRPRRPGWEVEVHTCSAVSGEGVPALWDAIVRAHDRLRSGELPALRARQNVAWMWSEVTETVLDRLRGHPGVRARLEDLEQSVASGAVPPATAAHEVLAAFGISE